MTIEEYLRLKPGDIITPISGRGNGNIGLEFEVVDITEHPFTFRILSKVHKYHNLFEVWKYSQGDTIKFDYWKPPDFNGIADYKLVQTSPIKITNRINNIEFD